MPEPRRSLKVFLSYASQDKLLVRELSRRLLGENWIDTWQDEKNLLPGQDWRNNIFDAVETSDIVIICLSNNSVNKEGYVQKELRFAQEIALEKPEDTLFLIPLRLEECNVPRGLRFYQWVDYFGEKKDSSYLALVASLKLRYEQKLNLEERLRKEQQEREAAEKAAREKAKQEERKRIAREKIERENAERKQKKIERHEASDRVKENKHGILEFITNIKPIYLLGAFIFIAAGTAFYTFSNRSLQLPGSTPTMASTLTITNEPSETPRPEATQTSVITASPTMGVGSTMTGVDGMNLLFVPAGNFKMGSSERSQLTELSGDNYPQYDHYLDSFWIDQTEVTNQQYAMCVSNGKCQPPLVLNSPRRSSYYNDLRYDDFPVIYIEWGMARAYCEWAGRRLPTEAEWEKAARGTDGRIYPWGNDVPNSNLLNYNSYWADTSVVRYYSRGKSPYGAYDMAGNVWEWTSSLYMPYPYDAADGREDASAKRDRVLRGGSWYFNPEKTTMSLFRYGIILDPDYLVRSDVRSFSEEEGSLSPEGLGIVGFRCAKDAP